jgi:hypothetical protein
MYHVAHLHFVFWIAGTAKSDLKYFECTSSPRNHPNKNTFSSSFSPPLIDFPPCFQPATLSYHIWYFAHHSSLFPPVFNQLLSWQSDTWFILPLIAFPPVFNQLLSWQSETWFIHEKVKCGEFCVNMKFIIQAVKTKKRVIMMYLKVFNIVYLE